MAKNEVILPQMGEGVIEATIIRWLVQINEYVEIGESIVEIATDKVDSEIQAPVSGKLIKQFYEEGDTPQVGDIVAILSTDSESDGSDLSEIESKKNIEVFEEKSIADVADDLLESHKYLSKSANNSSTSTFIRQYAKRRGISYNELLKLSGESSGSELTISDVDDYFRKNRTKKSFQIRQITSSEVNSNVKKKKPYKLKEGEESLKINHTRKLISERMVKSVQTIPHVTSFVEVDITHIVNWRESRKKQIKIKYGVNITYTSIIAEIVVKALKVFPNINVSFLDDNQLIRKKYINLGIATALPDGNLVVPVIKDADKINLVKLTKEIHDKSSRAREGSLLPGETINGTFTITNLGQSGNITGTPIINQPESAILAVGAIKKKPGVVDINGELTIGIRDILTLSLSYDHRIIDGMLGGSFLSEIAQMLEMHIPKL
jgi:2-oxoglutarate dehydrogenase E2 component (dihydrolipoamide succinyltransferase)